jgi:hypothetical protein
MKGTVLDQTSLPGGMGIYRKLPRIERGGENATKQTNAKIPKIT